MEQNPPRLFIVEDEAIVVADLVIRLNQMGYEVVEFPASYFDWPFPRATEVRRASSTGMWTSRPPARAATKTTSRTTSPVAASMATA